MRDSRAHVEAPGGRPEGRLIASCPSPPRQRTTGSVADTCTACCAATGDGGLEALEPRSRRPLTNPGANAGCGRARRIVALRTELTATGSTPARSRSPGTRPRGTPAPSTSTIRRVLHAAGLVVPEPRKRPRSSWIRFEAAAPNELWQSDVTHWRLADGSEVEIISWLDDHSRYLLGCTAFGRVERRRRRGHVHARRATRTAGRRPRSPTTARCTRRASPAAGTASSTCSPTWASARRTARPAIPRPRARSSASSRPSSAGSGASRPRAARRAAGPARRVPARTTTSSGRTGRSAGRRPARRTGRHRGRCPPARLRRGHFRAPLRRHRQQGRDDPAPGRPPAPPQGRRGPCPPARPGHRR